MAGKRRIPRKPKASGKIPKETQIRLINEQMGKLRRLVSRPQGLPEQEKRMYLETIEKFKRRIKELEG